MPEAAPVIKYVRGIVRTYIRKPLDFWLKTSSGSKESQFFLKAGDD